MKEIRAEIDIYAADTHIWQILTDFTRFPEWNPFLRHAAGVPKVGEQVTLTLQPSGRIGMPLRCTVLKVEPNHELRWISHLLVPGLFDGEHSFTLEAYQPNQVRFTQREVFTGLLAPFFLLWMGSGTRQGFKEMNRALKVRAEQTLMMSPIAIPVPA